MENIQTADATICGTSHRRMFYNNQDALSLRKGEDIIAGVVCDGCGSSAHSEVGAQLGARFIADKCIDIFADNEFNADTLRDEVIDYLRNLTQLNCQGSIDEFVREYLMFTIVGFVLKPDTVTLFWAGDGVTAIGDEVSVINQDNRPNYLAKALLGEEAELELRRVDAASASRLLVGTDGVEDIVSNQGMQFGEGVHVYTIDEMFAESQFFTNPIALTQYLVGLESSGSLLMDDTSLIMLKTGE